VAEYGWQVEHFEEYRPRLRAVAYRMLGSVSEADDAVQEAWLRFSRTDTRDVENLGGWLTTVVARLCLNTLQTRRSRREVPIGVHMPDPLVSSEDAADPEHEALLADAVGLALLVVLDTLTAAERISFVLHDMFAVPFEQIAPMVGRSSTATRQLASRARRRVSQGAPVPDTDVARQRQAVDAFFAAARHGDLAALVAVLDPDVVLRSDGGPGRPEASVVVRGAKVVAERAMTFAQLSPFVRPALVNGTAGVVVAPHGRLNVVMGFTVVDGVIVAIDALSDPDRLGELDLRGFGVGD